MGNSLGMVETIGLIGAVEASDAMVKTANVSLIRRQYTTGGFVAVLVRGDIGSVKASVDAGSVAAERVGQLVSSLVIPSPYDDIDLIVR